jgi:diguanylate cyclase (GGDEF)-like protein
MDPGDREIPRDRLLAIIDLQNELVASAPDLDTAMSVLAGGARELLGASAAVIQLGDRDEIVSRAASDAAVASVGSLLSSESALDGPGPQGGKLCCEDTQSDARVDSEACRRVGAASLACVALRRGEAAVGLIEAYDSRPSSFDAADVDTLALLADLVVAHVERASQSDEKGEASLHDSLTGLPNRRSFDERLAATSARARRHGSKVALCVLDLDRLRDLNAAYGSAAGDDVLQAVAGHLATVRGEDAAYRLGGDEFALLLEETTDADGRRVAGRLALAIRADPACAGVRISWGVAMVGGDPAESLAHGYASLARAKHAVS